MTRASANKFVQLALEAALKVACAQGLKVQADLDIAILGDNDFYSQDRSVGVAATIYPVLRTASLCSDLRIQMKAERSDAEPKPFAYLDTTLSDVHKTGLGSSAAMVTSLVAAIYIHCSASTQPTYIVQSQDKLRLIHNTAQFAHSKAQGKVGSGFDVSAAVWGSQIYQRFYPECLGSLLERDAVSMRHVLFAR